MAGPEYGPIQVPPTGLLGFLNIKNAGRNPSVLSGLVQPVLEMRDWYFNTQAEIGSVAFSTPITAATATGFRDFVTPTFIEVPNNQWWYLVNYSCWTSAKGAATDLFRARLAWGVPPSFTEVYGIGDQILEMDAATPLGAQPRCSGGGLWLPPLSHLGFWLESRDAAIDITVAGFARFARLPI